MLGSSLRLQYGHPLVTAGAAEPNGDERAYSEALRPIDAYPLQACARRRVSFCGAVKPIDFKRDLDWAGPSHGGLPIRGGSTIRPLSHPRPRRYRWSHLKRVAAEMLVFLHPGPAALAECSRVRYL
jgi:hypothetical protein